jgi:hypothetical protein
MNTHSPIRPTALWPTRAAWFAASLATLGGVLANREPDSVLGTGLGAFIVVFVLGRILHVLWQLLADGPRSP